jgi:hypothetical protein
MKRGAGVCGVELKGGGACEAMHAAVGHGVACACVSCVYGKGVLCGRG